MRMLEDHGNPVNAVTVTPDGQRAISASSDHTLRAWDVESGIYIAAFTGESPMSRCAIAPDGRTIIAREKSGRGHFLRLESLDSVLAAHPKSESEEDSFLWPRTYPV